MRALPRVKRGSAVVHVLNYAYDAKADDVTPQAGVVLTLDLKALGTPAAREARLHAPEGEAVTLPIRDGRLELPRLGLWSLIVLGKP